MKAEKKNRGRLFLAAALAILIALVAAETLARFLPGTAPAFPFLVRHMDRDIEFTGYIPDPDLFWTLKPGADLFLELEGLPSTKGRSNQLGLRGPDFPGKKPHGEKRVLFLGDSATFGLFVEDRESYPFQTEAILNRETGENWRAMNGAVTGYTSLQGRIFLETRGLALEPDMVVACFGHNDCGLRLFTDEQCRRWTREGRLEKYFALAGRLRHMKVNAEIRKAVGPERQVVPRVPPEDFFANMTGIIDLCREYGIPVFIMAAPGRYSRFAQGVAIHEIITNPLAEFAAKQKGATFIAIEELRDRGPESNEAWFSDAYHPNPDGHRRIALHVARAILESTGKPINLSDPYPW